MNAPAKPDVEWRDEYRALTEGVGFCDLGHRTQIEVTGADRASFLHNLTTNEIRKLPTGSGCETFFTTVQGKTLSHGFVFATPDSHVIDTVAGQAEILLAHLDHYLVSERVTFADLSQQRTELWLTGALSKALWQRLAATAPQARLAHAHATIAGRAIWVRKADFTGAGYLISVATEDAAGVRAAIADAGAVTCGLPAFSAARIEQGFPWFGQDISDKNLPQEVGRDALAISFTKGCYLGQETVARIDALGHVNKTLVGVQFAAASLPEPGLALSAGGEVVGHVTSAAYSPRTETTVSLAYVRRGSNVPGTPLNSALGDAKVVALPMR